MYKKYKTMGLVKTCNYNSPHKWVITNCNGLTIGVAPSLNEAKKKINEMLIRKDGR